MIDDRFDWKGDRHPKRMLSESIIYAPHYGPDCPVAVVARASWPDETIVSATLSTIVAAMKESAVERTALILVGPALAAQDFRESELYNADYARRFRGHYHREGE